MGKVISKPVRLRVKLHKSSTESSSRHTLSSGSSNSRESTFTIVDDRKYHNNEAVPYFLPADDDEADRTSIRHFLDKAAWDNTSFSSPMHEALAAGASVLDIGCGGATWLLDMASQFHASRFFGIDLDDIHPVSIKPPNLDFLQCNVLEGLPFADGKFDFVYMRYMTSAIPEHKWPDVISEIARITKSGGYMELEECDVNWFGEGPSAKRLRTLSVDVLHRNYNINIIIGTKLAGWLEETGQVRDVTEKRITTPIGGSTKIGKARLDILRWAIRNSKKAVNAFNLSDDEYNKLIKSAMEELMESEVLEPHYRAFAQKI